MFCIFFIEYKFCYKYKKKKTGNITIDNKLLFCENLTETSYFLRETFVKIAL